MPFDIPGYYFDKERNKYFKIQASANATTSAYTSEDVKKRKAGDLEVEYRTRKAQRESAKFKRAFDPNTTLSGFSMDRELGYRPNLDTPRRVLAKGLVSTGRFQAIEMLAEPLFIVKPCWDPADDEPVVDIHAGAGATITSSRVQINKKSGMTLLIKEHLRHSDEDSKTSISVHSSGMMTTTWFSGSDEGGIDVFKPFDENLLNPVPVTLYGPGRARGPEVDVLSSTPAPASSSLLFAYGTSKGILTMNGNNLELCWAKGNLCNGDCDAFGHDYVALTFLGLPSPNAGGHELLAGTRSGLVRLIDFRDKSTATLYPEHILFPSSITNIKQASEHGILISGLNDQLHQYDLRFLKPVTFCTSNSRSMLNKHPTAPIMTYSSYQNNHSSQAALDINHTAGIIAIGQFSDHLSTPRVNLLSLTTGESLPFPALDGPNAQPKGNFRPPRCVKWNEDIEGGMMSLYVSEYGGLVERFAWGGNNEED